MESEQKINRITNPRLHEKLIGTEQDLSKVAIAIIKREQLLAREANENHDIAKSIKYTDRYMVMVEFAQEMGLIQNDNATQK